MKTTFAGCDSIKKYKDLCAGIMVLALGIVVFAASFSVTHGAKVSVGSEFMPKITGVLLMIFGAWITRDGAYAVRNYKEKMNSNGQSQCRYKELVSTALLLVIYMKLLVPIGFVITTAVYITLQALILAPVGKKQPIKFAIIGTVVSLVVYFIFRNIFVLMLPAGILDLF